MLAVTKLFVPNVLCCSRAGVVGRGSLKPALLTTTGPAAC
jgi:hypothetical protein